jgi:hypothetical protein
MTLADLREELNRTRGPCICGVSTRGIADFCHGYGGRIGAGADQRVDLSHTSSHNILRCKAGIDTNVGVSCHRDRRSDAHFPPADGVEMRAVHPAMRGVIQGLMRCEIDVPQETLVDLGEACNSDFVAEVSACQDLLRTPDVVLPPAFINEVIDFRAFLVERNASIAQAHTTATSGLSNLRRYKAVQLAGVGGFPN